VSDVARPLMSRRLLSRPSALFGLGTLGVAIVAPLFLDAFWLQVGVFAFAAMVAALGLNLIVGDAGQLSLAHSFFIAVGAYSYTLFASESGQVGVSTQAGWGLPPLVAVVLAVGAAGIAGLLFSPIAARVRGIYLGVASLGLVFLGQHVLFNAEALTGGFNGRDVPPLKAFGLTLGEAASELWYVGLVVVVACWWFYRNVRASRAGRALHAVRDGEVAASVMGVNVMRAKGSAFLVSSMLAGLGGVLLALAFRHIVPETFGVLLAVEYMAMIVIGGVGSPSGTLAGALFVSSLPVVLQRYSDALPFLAESPAGGGITSGIAARYCYGAAIVVVLLVEPGGLAALGTGIRRRLASRHDRAALSAVPSPAAQPVETVATAS
jgi:branched-chain amino acid transport system permease protein